MALTGKENMPGVLPLPGKYAEMGQKERPLSTPSSKIPILSKSQLPSELKPLQQACSSAVKTKGLKMSKVSSVGVPVVEPAAGVLSKSHSREPLGEMQLSASGHRNVLEGGNANGKGASAVEFVPDAEALASILSDTGLSNQVVSATHKPSLARRVPLWGNRACSSSSGTGRGSLYAGATVVNPAHMSHLSRSAPKDVDLPPSCSLALNAQQLKTLSATLGNLGPGVETKDDQPMENLQADKCKDSVARPKTECLGSITEAGPVKQSNLACGKETTGALWTEEEFVPDPAAKASILLNIGLSHSALGAGNKLSLARRIPIKDVQKPPVCGSIRGGNASLPGYRMSAPPTAKFGRVSCRSTQGLKGLKESGAFGGQLPITPGNRCSAVDYSPSGLARRVPIVQSQPSHFRPWRCNRAVLSSCIAKRTGIRCLTETPQTKWMGGATPRCTGIVSSKKDGSPVCWEKIAVCLFDDGLEAPAKKMPAACVIPSDMGKLQRVEFLARLLQQEVNGGIDEVTPSLEELHKLLLVHCSPALEAPEPDLVTTPSQDPTPKLGEQTAVSVAPVAPIPDTTFTTANSQPACSVPSPSSANNTGFTAASSSSSVAHFKQRLENLLDAPRRFHEDCLNDECAFYMSRVTTFTQPSVPRCQEPVAKLLDAQDAMHFIPISSPQSPFTEAERSLPL
ncbi:PREDICTED: tastin [Gekko japonicus]|uniref:Tastin n=1 Tax=Gekko japonicus TaxID=146911 RepID=A0ABM1JIS5_GEKJA|nr:PREDICTED: tastin [Gekko japonicus]